MKIGILSPHNAYDRNSFSGTLYYMRQALEAREDVQVTVLGGHRPPRTGLWGRLDRLRAAPGFHIETGDDAGLDVVLAPVAMQAVAECQDRLSAPVFMITDATPAFLKEFYGEPITEAYADTEARVLDQAAGAIYSSHYMAERALGEFPRLDADKVHVLPFGLNLDTLPEVVPAKPPLERLELLFIGQDWARKGGDIALDALDALEAAGQAARLTVIGASAPRADRHKSVRVLGYLNKNKPRDSARFTEALARAHLLVFPTRADCTPMVIAEANAYGCPVLVSETGGIATLMAPGRNGQMLPLAADGAEFARAILSLVSDPEGYAQMSRSSRAWCEQTLTWKAWAEGIVKLSFGVVRS